MIATILLLENASEIETEKEKYGTSISKEKYIEREIGFDENFIEMSYLNSEGNISLVTRYNDVIEILYTKENWNRLKTRFA